MKMKSVIQIIAENYEEEQLVLQMFPDVFWTQYNGKTRFYIPTSETDRVKFLINKMKG